MNKLLKQLMTLLSISSTLTATTTVISCTVSNNQKADGETKKDDDQSEKINNDNQDTNNNNVDSNLSKINDIYFNQTIKEFKEITTSFNDIKNMILNRDLPDNFYSHSDFYLDKSEVILDEKENDKVLLKLINKKTGLAVSNSEIKWYQRTLIPYDEVFSVNQNDHSKVTFKLLNDGTMQWKDNTDPNDQYHKEDTQAKIYAEYKGYLFSANVRVLNKAQSDLNYENNLARKAAKDIVEKHNWKELPTLERLKQAYDWITKNVEYDFNKDNLFKNQNAYTALVTRKTVCTGYAKGLQMLLDELDIPCKVVEGESTREDGAKHAWNQVLVDNKWYYVDPTSDRVDTKKGEKETKYTFFLNTDKDFSLDDRFTRNQDSEDAHLRNLFAGNFVGSKEDFLGLIDNNYDVETKIVKSFEILIPNGDANENKKPDFRAIHKALEERGHLETKSTFLPSKGSFYVVKYSFPNIQKTPDNLFKEVNIKNIKRLNNRNAIEVEFDQEVNGLIAQNFNITNALIKSIKQNGKSYILNLYHFNSFGDVKVKLESVKRKDYKFNILNDSTVIFKLEKQKLNDIRVKIINDEQVEIISENKNLEYSFQFSKWQNVNQNLIINMPGKEGKLLIRSKSDLSPEFKTIQITRPSLFDFQLKTFNNAIVGVDESMEYRKQGSQEWISIDKNKITNLDKNSTYEVRYKATDHSFASESVFVTIA
ncbi:MAG6410 family transglutaminase-related lipoprotein [Mycoplasma yeatsii]|uniref:MAG6410 family transglutaminase-related lipoprotein n=1 Tax=Mycoplasma yeatsii TaxID=51365 RepID=UPI0005B24032|nr:transglutaminase domain-containing protein [Mycoplasma yeatsii]AJM71945.1 lipoprotein [Mycoplasma yeatsii GM274B]